ncbi:MAG: hypothetical protein HQK96_17800 [Nitrospirae bacterium]|nr:hypothetical protein [Nitrospirota bacterium]
MNSAMKYVDSVLNEGTKSDFDIGTKVIPVHGWRNGKITSMTKAGITVKWSNGEVTENIAPNLLIPVSGAKTFREAAKRKSASTAKGDYIEYLNDTLIPDLKENGSTATAEDFAILMHILKTGAIPPKGENDESEWATVEDFRKYLEETLIPDLKESGRTATADDFEEGLRYLPIAEKKKESKQ